MFSTKEEALNVVKRANAVFGRVLSGDVSPVCDVREIRAATGVIGHIAAVEFASFAGLDRVVSVLGHEGVASLADVHAVVRRPDQEPAMLSLSSLFPVEGH